MKFLELFENVSDAMRMAKDKIEDNTGLMIGAGIVTLIAGAVTAIVATTKNENEGKTDEVLEEIDRSRDVSETIGSKKPIIKAYTKGFVKLGKAYLPTVGCLAAGTLLILRAHALEVRRSEQLMAAYIALSEAFAKYRKKVQDKIGAEEESKLYYNNKNGEKEQELLVTEKFNGLDGSIVEYNEKCAGFTHDAYQNLMDILAVKGWLDSKYNRCGRVYLNDFLRHLGHDEIENGYDWMWVKTEACQKIDLGLGDPINALFAKGQEPVCKIILKGLVHKSVGEKMILDNFHKVRKVEGLGKKPVYIN